MPNPILHSIAEVTAFRTRCTQTNPNATVGFVPTMGALHAGHRELVRQASAAHDHVLVSIFVNPTQFGPNEDFAKYPRTLANDAALLADFPNVTVWAPDNAELYPQNYSTFVEENTLTQNLCGRFRPGHFKGVTTIVLKLFNLIRPHAAYFGKKDLQQYFVIKKMVEDLHLPIKIIGADTVREASGLALSSRNQYLSPEERHHTAPILYKTLTELKATLIRDARSATTTTNSTPAIEVYLTESADALHQHGFKVQYLELVSLPHLEPLHGPIGQLKVSPTTAEPQYALITAAYLNQTRLIDNLDF